MVRFHDHNHVQCPFLFHSHYWMFAECVCYNSICPSVFLLFDVSAVFGVLKLFFLLLKLHLFVIQFPLIDFDLIWFCFIFPPPTTENLILQMRTGRHWVGVKLHTEHQLFGSTLRVATWHRVLLLTAVPPGTCLSQPNTAHPTDRSRGNQITHTASICKSTFLILPLFPLCRCYPLTTICAFVSRA